MDGDLFGKDEEKDSQAQKPKNETGPEGGEG